MRVLYVCIGLLLGISFTSRLASYAVERLQDVNRAHITASALMGYHEGWQIGKAHAAAEYRFSLLVCNEALKRTRERRTK
jgi:hypothetical protein